MIPVNRPGWEEDWTVAVTDLAADHVVVVMLENRSSDHMLGYLYLDTANVSPCGDPFEGLTGAESCPGPDLTSAARRHNEVSARMSCLVVGLPGVRRNEFV